MQEDIERRMIAVSITATKLTAKTLAKCLAAVVHMIQREHQKSLRPQGKQSAKKLMNHGVATNTLPLDGETRLFDRVARKWNVDYSFHKTGPKKYLLLFKAGQADAITACLAEYTKRIMTKEQRPSILQQLQKLGAQAPTRQRPQERKREVAHEER